MTTHPGTTGGGPAVRAAPPAARDPDRDPDALRGRAEELLRALAGPGAALREDQWRAIRALVVERRRALVVQRTGWGKSAVYFVATALLREAGAGPTVIVSPLLALIRNQTAAAAAAGIRAGEIHSGNVTEWDAVYAALRAGELDVLLVGPERLNNPTFRDDYLPELAATTGLLVVDEAHCISDWGHDFRPDYRRLRTLMAGLPPGVPVLATTATANNRVTTDVAEQLGTDAAVGNGDGKGDGDGDGAGAEGPLVLRGPLDRESLRLAVVRLPRPEDRFAWLAEHLDELPGSGIVYALTKQAAEELTAFLTEAGVAVACYHGGTEPAERIEAERSLLANTVKALVATTALGMGFDKPDLGFVVHLGAPPSAITYYQQIGRAGRGVDRAEVVLLPGPEDVAIWRWFADASFPSEEVVRHVLAVLDGAPKAVSTRALLPAVAIGQQRLESMLKVLDVDGAVRRVAGGWQATGRPWAYDADRYARVAEARRQEQRRMLDYLDTTGCRMEFLRRQLDDPDASPCGRCDTCTRRPWPATVSTGGSDRARERLARPGVDVEPRKMWPTGMSTLGVPLAGRIPARAAAEPGRALARANDLGWGTRLRSLLADDAPDAPVPDDVVAAAVKVLASWSWSNRPVGVVTVASRRRPALVASLGAQLSAIGRLPLLGQVERTADRPPAGTVANSARRLHQVWDAFALPAEASAAVGGAGGPILVVDDRILSGWTMTVVARLLREAGAPAVLPFALALDAG
jgi:ATP-dependent DNA helicase RecQ